MRVAGPRPNMIRRAQLRRSEQTTLLGRIRSAVSCRVPEQTDPLRKPLQFALPRASKCFQQGDAASNNPRSPVECLHSYRTLGASFWPFVRIGVRSPRSLRVSTSMPHRYLSSIAARHAMRVAQTLTINHHYDYPGESRGNETARACGCDPVLHTLLAEFEP